MIHVTLTAPWSRAPDPRTTQEHFSTSSVDAALLDTCTRPFLLTLIGVLAPVLLLNWSKQSACTKRKPRKSEKCQECKEKLLEVQEKCLEC